MAEIASHLLISYLEKDKDEEIQSGFEIYFEQYLIKLTPQEFNNELINYLESYPS
jgi:hypothetical protein